MTVNRRKCRPNNSYVALVLIAKKRKRRNWYIKNSTCDLRLTLVNLENNYGFFFSFPGTYCIGGA